MLQWTECSEEDDSFMNKLRAQCRCQEVSCQGNEHFCSFGSLLSQYLEKPEKTNWSPGADTSAPTLPLLGCSFTNAPLRTTVERPKFSLIVFLSAGACAPSSGERSLRLLSGPSPAVQAVLVSDGPPRTMQNNEHSESNHRTSAYSWNSEEGSGKLPGVVE